MPGLACAARLASRQIPILALLHICGPFALQLPNLTLARVHIHSPASHVADDTVPWASALLALGGGVAASVTGARVLDNSGSSPLAVTDGAALALGAGCVLARNRAVWGAGVHCTGSRTAVTVGADARLSRNTAHHSGGAIFSSGSCRVALEGGSVIDASDARFFGGGIQGDEAASIRIGGAARILNCSAAYGGAAAVKNSAAVEVSGRALVALCTAEYGGGIAAQVCGSGADMHGAGVRRAGAVVA